jgi:hypothetical protein
LSALSNDYPMPLHWKIDECAVYFDRMRLGGWCHHSPSPIIRIELLLGNATVVRTLESYGRNASPDVAAFLGPTASRARFEEWVVADADLLGRVFALKFWLADGTFLMGEETITNAAHGDPYYESWEKFFARLPTLPPGRVLEIGSRARTGLTQRHRMPPHLDYVGLDILPGPNVDVVGDAHELSRLFPPNHFAAVFSLSVFEHLAMPWKVAVEINRVLSTDGLVFTMSHQSWPPHEEPWDFWRFSKFSWQTLFNRATGFEILETACGEPGRLHPMRTSPVNRDMPSSLCWLGSTSLARKVADTSLDWPVPLRVAAADNYPAGETEMPT